MSPAAKSILETENLVKTFGGLKAVDHVSFSVPQGQIRGLIGPNASGKTTIINLISGMYKINSGAIFFSERRIDRLRPNVITSMGIMRTFQISRVFGDMTVLENMMVPGLSQGESMTQAQRRAEELLEFVLLDKLRNEPASNLSGG